MTDIQKQAYQDYRNGMKAVDISNKYDVPAATVRTWINRTWKQKNVSNFNKKSETKSNKKVKRRGAPAGNQNAVGNTGGAPEQNQNNLKHGAYCKVFDGVFDDDEKALIENMTDDPETIYNEELKLYTVREHRILQRIKELRDSSENFITERTRSRRLEIKAGLPKFSQNQSEVTAEKISKSDALNKLETELTKIQAGKTRCAVELAKLKAEKKDTGNKEAVDDWVTAVMESGYE